MARSPLQRAPQCQWECGSNTPVRQKKNYTSGIFNRQNNKNDRVSIPLPSLLMKWMHAKQKPNSLCEARKGNTFHPFLLPWLRPCKLHLRRSDPWRPAKPAKTWQVSHPEKREVPPGRLPELACEVNLCLHSFALVGVDQGTSHQPPPLKCPLQRSSDITFLVRPAVSEEKSVKIFAQARLD